MNKIVYIKTTEGCQLDCKHCFTGGNSSPRDFFDVKKTLEWARRFSELDLNHVHFEIHGGEPMLAPIEDLNELVKGLRELPIKNISIGMTTNLVYTLNKERFDFISSLDSVATSWDDSIRFQKPGQLHLWTKNVRTLVQRKIAFTINVSLTRSVVNMDQTRLLNLLYMYSPTRVMFERITHDGKAQQNDAIIPSNKEIDAWYVAHHKAIEKLEARNWFVNSALEAVYTKFENGVMNCGTFCRDCEQKIFTINANGTIAGCPNGAPTDHYGHIDQPISELLDSSGRKDLIVKEITGDDNAVGCYGCPVYSVCGGDCYRLSWQGNQCASPKSLMMLLSGIEPTINEKPKTYIPIMKA